MMKISRRKKPFIDTIFVKGDREAALATILLAWLCKGKSRVANLPDSAEIRSTLAVLESMGLEHSREDEDLILCGAGPKPVLPDVLQLPESLYASVLLLAAASAKHGENFSIRCDKNTLEKLQHYLFPSLLAKIVRENKGLTEILIPFPGSDEDERFRFEKPDYLKKAFLLFLALFSGEGTDIEEPGASRETLAIVMRQFGVSLDIRRATQQEEDEFQRRLAKLRGIRSDKSQRCILAALPLPKASKIMLSGDCTRACALALQAALIPGSERVLENVALSPARAGSITALKRMGADLEILKKQERAGESYGKIRVRGTRRMCGRQFSGEASLTLAEEFPLLTVAACFAEGETIIRDVQSDPGYPEALIRQTTEVLRDTGVDVGWYEEGIVIRGRLECDSTTFDGAEHPVLSLAFRIMAQASHGNSLLKNCENVEEFFPEMHSLSFDQLEENEEVSP